MDTPLWTSKDGSSVRHSVGLVGLAEANQGDVLGDGQMVAKTRDTVDQVDRHLSEADKQQLL